MVKLDKKNITIFHISSRRIDILLSSMKDANFKYYRLYYFKNHFRPGSLFGYRRFIGIFFDTIYQLLYYKKKFDVLIIDCAEYYFLAKIISKILKTKIVFYNYGNHIDEVNEILSFGKMRIFFFKKIITLYINYVFNDCSKLISTYPNNTTDINSLLLNKKVIFISEPNKIRYVNKSNQSIPNHYIFMATNFNYKKKCFKILDYLDIFKKIINENPNLKIVIAGNGKYLEEFKNIIKTNNLNKDFLILGFVKNFDEYLSNCKYFIHLSDQDTGPKVVFEAMKLKKNVIINDYFSKNSFFRNKINVILIGNKSELYHSHKLLFSNNPVVREMTATAYSDIDKINKSIPNQWISLIKSL